MRPLNIMESWSNWVWKSLHTVWQDWMDALSLALSSDRVQHTIEHDFMELNIEWEHWIFGSSMCNISYNSVIKLPMNNHVCHKFRHVMSGLYLNQWLSPPLLSLPIYRKLNEHGDYHCSVWKQERFIWSIFSRFLHNTRMSILPTLFWLHHSRLIGNDLDEE